ncbi:MAG: DNA methyltransferase [Candidatus Nanopelagicales bacterium]|nr:DNA methyltransferase [Candidatus Nanopelagicales bacterium]
MEYSEFLAGKKRVVLACGRIIGLDEINPVLFPFQRDLTRWAVRKGRAAIFADTGLGKTLMQLEWARLTGGRCLIVAPLSVARQTVAEGLKIGVTVHYSRDGSGLAEDINITNYEMVEHFDPADFDAVVLDESSILKSLDGKTRKRLTEMFASTPARLCCTATPAPNDIAEIANHAEFLGIMTRTEMLSAFFVHDDEGWRLKGHASEPFFRWLASWGMSVRKPSDLGYQDDGFILPELTIQTQFVETDVAPDGALFFTGLKGITDRASVRRRTAGDRVQAAADRANGDAEQWILWCGLNQEADALARLVLDAVNVQGSDDSESKAAALEAFQDGRIRVLITKPRIAGFGMNFQNCARMAFVGLNDSWEAYYQCIRRCWRFGQKRPVEVTIVISEAEEGIYRNVQHKEQEAARMADSLVEHIREFEQEEIHGDTRQFDYATNDAHGEGWHMMLGDSVERLAEVPADSVHLSVYSPPFQSLYTYSPTERDLGNSGSPEEFFAHYQYIIRELLRVTMPGRNTCVHIAEIPAMLERDGFIGMKDMTGAVIEQYRTAGWVYHGRVTIDKDPQAQAIRTHSKGLLFVQLKKDASWLRPALADYILVFRKPGDNATPIHPDLTNDEWIEWARPIWYGIKESDTLNAREGRDQRDDRHICPLQLGTIERCIRLWSNPGELVLSPFAGIGSEGYVSLQHGRRFVGCELKQSYFAAAVRNLERARYAGQRDMFGESGEYLDTPESPDV